MIDASGAGSGARAARAAAFLIATVPFLGMAGPGALHPTDPPAPAPTLSVPEAPACSVRDPDPPAYYRIDLVTTRRVPGTSFSGGSADVTFRNESPFGIALAEDGSYHYDVRIAFDALPEPPSGVYAVWVTSTQLDRVIRVGALAPGQRAIDAAVDWNQFLVVVSLEPSAEGVGARWSGPIVMRGISRSGLMHTMAGHGPFEQENCAAYGYD